MKRVTTLIFTMLVLGIGFGIAQVPAGTASSKTDSNGKTTYHDSRGFTIGSSTTDSNGKTTYKDSRGFAPEKK